MLDVIGAGFGRTGTLSLKKALEILGRGPCYHMAEVVARPDHVDLWRAAWRGAAPWDALFEGFRAAVDWPAVAFWPRLMHRYPAATIVLTLREPESWFRSARDTIFQAMQETPPPDDPARCARQVMLREIIVEGTFHGDLDDADRAVAVYRAHVARVEAEVPPERLVRFDPRDGWPPLCRALGCAVPDVPFPRLNRAGEFIERWRGGDPNRELASSR